MPDSNPYAAELAATQAIDPTEFTRLAEQHRRELQVHCYRLLGSLTEAEDLVQETYLRAWRKRATYAGRASLRAWLYRIATNACLDELDKRPARTLPPEHQPAADPHAPFAPPLQEPIWLEPYPDEWLPDLSADPEAEFTQRERISLAFLIALQHLPPRQRAVLLLSDVLDWRASEIAEALEMTVSAVNSALHRARETLARPKPSKPARLEANTEALLARYVRAWEEADIGSLVALLKEEAIFAMPPSPSWYAGRSSIGAFLGGTMLNAQMRGVWHLVPVRANGALAYALFQRSPETGELQPVALQTLIVEGEHIAVIHSFMQPNLVARFMPSGH